MKRSILTGTAVAGLLAAAVATAQVGPTTTPATRPARSAITVLSADGTRRPATGPVAVPYSLSRTNHLVVRLKLNGRGPYNFIVDTGCPILLIDEDVAAEIGLQPEHPTTAPTTIPTTQPLAPPNKHAWTTLDTLDLEGGLSLSNVRGVILTPYQLTGMNSIGVAGVPLHGLLGYSVLARFKLDVDLAHRQMLWTPQPDDYVPRPLRGTDGGTTKRHGDAPSEDVDPREWQLETMGSVLKVLGPLLKASMPPPPKPRGEVGLLLTTSGQAVTVDRVLDGSPAAAGGVQAGDELVSVDKHAVHTVADAEQAAARATAGRAVQLVVRRGPTTRALTVTTTEGL